MWKSTIITAILKAGKNASLPQSYRPVALLSCLSKVLERFVHEQLSSFLLESKALPDDQFMFGFLRGLPAKLQLLSVIEKWHNALDQRHLVRAVFLDAATWSRAFNRVDHLLLLQSRFIRWESEYNGCKATCRIGWSKFAWRTTLSTAASITSGVPQGSVLGPLLFLVHFSRGIMEAMGPSQTSLFAIDTTAFEENCSGRQSPPCCGLGKHLGSLSCSEQHRTTWTLLQRSQPILLLDGSHHRQLASAWTAQHYPEFKVMSTYLGIYNNRWSDLRWNDHVATVLKKSYLHWTWL